MIEAFKENRQKLFVAYYRRRLPRFLKAKEIIESGKLGTLSGIEYAYTEPVRTGFDPHNPPWRYTAEHGGGGLFLDLGSHTLDIIDYFLGPLTEVHGDAMNIASPYEVEDIVTMKFRAGNVPGTAQWNFAAFSKRDLIRFTGTEGRLELSCFGTDPPRVETETGVEEFALTNPEHIEQPLIQSVVNDILGREEAPSTGETAVRSSEVIDKVLSGYYGGRSDEFWKRPETWPGRRMD
jgi:predicted dehydrogenase